MNALVILVCTECGHAVEVIEERPIIMALLPDGKDHAEICSGTEFKQVSVGPPELNIPEGKETYEELMERGAATLKQTRETIQSHIDKQPDMFLKKKIISTARLLDKTISLIRERLTKDNIGAAQ